MAFVERIKKNIPNCRFWQNLRQRHTEKDISITEPEIAPYRFLSWIPEKPEELFDPIRSEMSGLLEDCQEFAGITKPKDLIWIDKTAALAHHFHDRHPKKESNRIRKDGLPYISHLIRSARKTAQKCLSIPLILATLLHDIFEDTEATEEEIRAFFCEENETLTNRVIKHINTVTKITGPAQEPREAETELSFYMAAFSDPGGIIIKFSADRIDNLMTLDYLSPEKQHQVAVQSYRLANLAGRLGMEETGGEIKELSLPYLYDPDSPQAEAIQTAFSNRQTHRQEFLANFSLDNFKKLLPPCSNNTVVNVAEKMPITAFYRHIDTQIQVLPPQSVAIPITIIASNADDFTQIFDSLTAHLVEKPVSLNGQSIFDYQLGDFHLKIRLFTSDGWLRYDSSIIDLYRRRPKKDPYLQTDEIQQEKDFQKRRRFGREKLKGVRAVIEPLQQEYQKAKESQDPALIEKISQQILAYASEDITLPFITVKVDGLPMAVPKGATVYEVLFRSDRLLSQAPYVEKVLINGEETPPITKVDEGDNIIIADTPVKQWTNLVTVFNHIITEKAVVGLRSTLLEVLDLAECNRLLELITRYAGKDSSDAMEGLEQIGLTPSELKEINQALSTKNPLWMQQTRDELQQRYWTTQQLNRYADEILSAALPAGRELLVEAYAQRQQRPLDIHIEAAWSQMSAEFRQRYDDNFNIFTCQCGIRNVPVEEINLYIDSVHEYRENLPQADYIVPNKPLVLARLTAAIGVLANILQVRITHNLHSEPSDIDMAGITIFFEAGEEQAELLKKMLNLVVVGLTLNAQLENLLAENETTWLASRPIGRRIYPPLARIFGRMPILRRSRKQEMLSPIKCEINLDLTHNQLILPYDAIIESLGILQKSERKNGRLEIVFKMNSWVKEQLELNLKENGEKLDLLAYLKTLLDELATPSSTPPPSSSPALPSFG